MIRPAARVVRLIGQAHGRDARTGRAVGALAVAGSAAGSSHRPKASRARIAGFFAESSLDVARPDPPRRTQPLRLGHRPRSRAGPFVGHEAQEEVRRAVDDAADACDPVGRQFHRERPEDRSATATAASNEGRAGPRRDRLQLRPVVGDDVLVRVTTPLPIDSGPDQRVCRLVATMS